MDDASPYSWKRGRNKRGRDRVSFKRGEVRAIIAASVEEYNNTTTRGLATTTALTDRGSKQTNKLIDY